MGTHCMRARARPESQTNYRAARRPQAQPGSATSALSSPLVGQHTPMEPGAPPQTSSDARMHVSPGWHCTIASSGRQGSSPAPGLQTRSPLSFVTQSTSSSTRTRWSVDAVVWLSRPHDALGILGHSSEARVFRLRQNGYRERANVVARFLAVEERCRGEERE